MKSHMMKLGLLLSHLERDAHCAGRLCTASLNWRSDITTADRSTMVKACASGWFDHWWPLMASRTTPTTGTMASGPVTRATRTSPWADHERVLPAQVLLLPVNKWGDMSGWVVQWGYPYAGAQFVDANGMQAHCGDYKNGQPKNYASTHDSWPEDHF